MKWESFCLVCSFHKRYLKSAKGQFHVKGPRKKVHVEKWIFFNEMWKIIGQINDFDRFLNNSYNLGVFLAKNKNTQKWLFWKSENWKKEEKKFKIGKLMSNIIYIILIVLFFYFVCLFCCLQCFRHFYIVLAIFIFSSSILWKMRSSKCQAVFNVKISWLNKTSYPKKCPSQCF